MRLLVLSDLHVEEAPFEPTGVAADVVVLAGDIHGGPRALRWAREAFPHHPIVQVAGNHEFYDGEHGDTLRAMRTAARDCGVHFLEQDTVAIDGVRFLGCTLWTDFRVFEVSGRARSMPAEAAMQACERLLADYRAISVDEGGSTRRFAPTDAARLHAASRAWLERELGRPHAGPTVVVTHHLPSWRSVHPAFASSVSNAGFASDLDPLVARADCWIHGHTHASRRYRIGGAEVVCNPRGYPRTLPAAPGQAAPIAFENPGFDAGLSVELAGA